MRLPAAARRPPRCGPAGAHRKARPPAPALPLSAARPVSSAGAWGMAFYDVPTFFDVMVAYYT